MAFLPSSTFSSRIWCKGSAFTPTPILRNTALTALYMHSRVFNTPEEAIDFYERGGGAGRGICPETQTLPVERLT